MKHDDLTAAAASLGVDLPAGAAERLTEYAALLRQRAVPLGVVAASDAERILERHVLDCLRAAALVAATDQLALDVGSGAGLPGIVVAIARPGLRVRLVEPRRKRVAFLELAAETLAPNATVVGARIEDVDEIVDLAFARAFAPPRRAWHAIHERLRTGGRLVVFAGAAADGDHVEGPSRIEAVRSPVLASSGPLIIMTR